MSGKDGLVRVDKEIERLRLLRKNIMEVFTFIEDKILDLRLQREQIVRDCGK